MTFSLRSGETIQAEAHQHWSNVSNWLVGALAVAAIAGWLSVNDYRRVGLFGFIFAALLLVTMILKIISRRYLVTSDRLHLEEGIFTRARHDIPLSKINDFQTSQSVWQSTIGAADVRVRTGNDEVLVLSNLANADEFVAAALKTMSTSATRAFVARNPKGEWEPTVTPI